MNERTARCLGWLQGFSAAVWALVSTNEGAKLFDCSAAEEYDKVVKELADELSKEAVVNPYGVVAVPLATPVPDTTTKPSITWELTSEKDCCSSVHEARL